MYPSSIRNLIECLKDLPGIGEKSAERLAYAIVGFDKDKLDNFAIHLLILKIILEDVNHVIVLLIWIYVIYVMIKIELVIRFLLLKSQKI